MIDLPMKNDPSIYVYEEKEVQKSTWINKTTDTISFKLMTHQKRVGRDNRHHKDGSKCQGSVFLLVTLKPGETIELPSEYDNSIRTVSPKTGQVSQGLAPCLTKVGEEHVVVPDVFDYKAAIQEEEAMNVLKQVKKENDIRAALGELDKRRAKKAEEDAMKASLEAEKQESVVEKRGPGRPPGTMRDRVKASLGITPEEPLIAKE